MFLWRSVSVGCSLRLANHDHNCSHCPIIHKLFTLSYKSRSKLFTIVQQLTNCSHCLTIQDQLLTVLFFQFTNQTAHTVLEFTANLITLSYNSRPSVPKKINSRPTVHTGLHFTTNLFTLSYISRATCSHLCIIHDVHKHCSLVCSGSLVCLDHSTLPRACPVLPIPKKARPQFQNSENFTEKYFNCSLQFRHPV